MHGQPQADPGKEVGRRTRKLSTQAFPKFTGIGISRSPGFRLMSGLIQQIFPKLGIITAPTLLLSSEPILLNWTLHPLQINKILYEATQLMNACSS